MTFKRILAMIVIALSVLGLTICIMGVIGVWAINTPVTENLTGALDRTAKVLDFTLVRIEFVGAELTQVEDLLSAVEETVGKAGESFAEKSPTMTFLSNTVGTELKPKIEATAEIVSTIRGTIVSVNSTIETANNIPFVNVPTLPMEQLSALDQQMQALVTTVKSFGETVLDFEAGVVDRTATAIMIPVDKLSELIAQIQTPLETFNANLQQVKIGVVDAKNRIPALIDWVSILTTLLLTWFILAQASLLIVGRYYLKTGTIPTVQIPNIPNSSGG